MFNYEVIIVGGGPAGCSSALQLLNLAPHLAGRVLLLDKAVFPRAKLCAGGLSPDADRALSGGIVARIILKCERSSNVFR